MVEPTTKNLAELDTAIVKGTRQSGQFLAKARVRIVVQRAGQTLFIPAGTIHAVYTAEKSIMYGGDVLNPFDMPIRKCYWPDWC